MKQNFTTRIAYDGKTTQAIIIPEHRKDGMYYEVNIKGYDRFYMHYGPMDRYEVAPQQGLKLPDNLVLAVSDAIEEKMGKG